MCAPMALGALSAVSGIAGQAGSFMGQQQQAAAQNAQITAQNNQNKINYKYKVASNINDWNNTKEMWAAKKSEYQEGLYNNRTAAGKAYGAASAAEEKLFREYVANSQNARVQALGAATGTGESRGRTAEMLSKLPNRQAGVQMSNEMDNLRYSQDAISDKVMEARSQWDNQNRQSWRQVSIQPKPGLQPPPPLMQRGVAGPSGLGLMAGIGQSILGGVQTFNSLKPPGPGEAMRTPMQTPNIQSLGIPMASAMPINFGMA